MTASDDEESSAQLVPQKMILTPEDLESWLAHPHFDQLWSFLQHLVRAIQGRPIEQRHRDHDGTLDRGSVVGKLVMLLNRVEASLEHFPANEDAANGRFGHPAFRDFYDHVHRVNHIV